MIHYKLAYLIWRSQEPSEYMRFGHYALAVLCAAQFGKALAEIFTKHGDLLEGCGEA